MRYTYKKTLLIISALFLLVSFNAFSQQTAVNDSVVLDEVIVTSLNIPKKQRALAYNVQTVEGEEISKKPNADFINSLSGSTSGVLINSSSGDAGSSTFITIRGSGSISGNNQPLFVVDGFPVISGGGSSGVGGVNTSSRSIDINPNDIKSVKILKGGAASALYGVRASNGVILIETKSGKGLNKAKVEFSSTFTVDRVSQLPARQTTYAQGNNGSWIGGFSRTWGPKISELEYDGDASYQWDPNGSLVPVGTGNGIPAVAYNPYDFFQAAPAIENHFSISNGEGNTDYYFSISNLDKEGIIPNNKFERVTARLSGGTTFKEKFKIRTNLSWTNTDETQIQKGSNVSGIMLGLLRTPPTFDNSAGYEFGDGSQRNYRNGGGYDNPYWAANNIAYERDINRVTLGTNFDYEFSDKISLSYNAGLDFYNDVSSNTFKIGSRDKSTGYYTEFQSYNQIFNSDLILKYSDEFGDLEVDALVGSNIYSTYYKGLFADASDLEIPNYYNLNNTSSNTVSGTESNTRSKAYYADLQLGYKDYLYLGVTARKEWFTTIPSANNGVIYPSASLSFVFSELIDDPYFDFIDFGKLRLSAAKTANPASAYSTSNYYYQASTADGWTDGVDFPFLGSTGFAVGNSLGNPNLKHETQESKEIGLELVLFDKKVSVDFAYFQDNNSDLLMSVPIAASTGYSSLYTNAASIKKQGVELSLNVIPIETDDFKWEVRTNYTEIDNLVTSLADGVDNVFLGGFTDPQVRAVAGSEYGSIFGFDWARDAAGNVLINDDPTDSYRDGYPWTDTSEMVPLGKVLPDWTANFTNTLSYKDFTLSFLIDIKKGGKMYNGTVFTMNYFGTSKVTENREVYYTSAGTIDFSRTPAKNIVVINGVYGHYDSAGNVVSSGVPNATPVVLDEVWFEGAGGNFGGGPTALAVEPTDWVRLRDITLAYDISSFSGLDFVDSAQIFVSGKNLFVDTPYSGIDPETSLLGASNGQGFDYFNSPGSKSVSLGVKLNF